jgi:DNA-binding GntR family transcriptional regulator
MTDEAAAALNRRTTSAEIAARLRTEILRGSIEPGTRLRQREIAERFDVSTTPVREAFAQLQAQGFLKADPHRGAIVFRPTIEDLREIFEIRETLEVLAIRTALVKLDDERLEELDGILRQMRRTRDQEEWVALNNRFHLVLYEAAQMPRLLRMIERLRDAGTPYIHFALSTKPPTRMVEAEHKEILAACKARDPERAERAVRLHLESTMWALLDTIPSSE